MSKGIFDAHIHINDNFTIKDCVNQMNEFQIESAIVMPDPIDPQVFTLSKATGEDVSNGGIRIKMTFDGKGYYAEKAHENGVLGGDLADDYWFKINKNLIKACENYDNVFPYILLPVNSHLAKQVLERLEKQHYGKFFGLKLHPNAYSYPVHRFSLRGEGRKMDYPIIIHTGVTQYDNPKNALKFARQYAGNVCLAHCARFDFETLEAISKMKNVYIDISPSYYLSSVSGGNSSKVYNGGELFEKTPTELLLMLINIVGEDKILAGSDAPYGSIEEYKKLSELLEISPKLLNKIFKENIERFNSKAYMKFLTVEELKKEKIETVIANGYSTFGD